ncbi:RNA binding protein, putative [Paecilomyces variotii No. 5]|uniref:RNA binding protein, putative n=1 Tax=Byssochlamys spectabilis (strain No. 5 / NBRC 109023) TaxID=1356009 RepID=V5FGK9_BYSSN|nr:RNA binding protein, putative [Paecilomyces variotii No. 5]
MLQPFKIRDLKSQTSSAGVHAGALVDDSARYTPAKRDGFETVHDVRRDGHSQHRHGVVVLSASEYDHIISTHPRAALMYMDPDDGETITVGSSLELSQRLEDPVFDSPHSWPSSSSPVSSALQDNRDQMHIFDIRRSNSITGLWKRYEREDRCPEQSSAQISSPEDVKESSTSAFGDVSTGDIRQRWLRACNPPQIPKREQSPSKQETRLSVSASAHDESSSMPPTGDNVGEKVASQGSGASSLTAEGKRQAQEAGARMRGWRRTPDINTSNFMPLPSIQGNPWSLGASVTRPASVSLEASSLPEATQRLEPSASDEAQPLLAAFEAEMSKIMEAHTAAEGEGPEASISIPDTGAQRAPQPSNTPKPTDLLVHAMHSVIGGVELIGSELRARLPEIERQVSSAQRTFPEQIRPTLQNALSTLDGRVKDLASALGEASIASGHAADRVRAAEFPQAQQAVNDFRVLASELSQMGSTLFDAFRTEFGPPFTHGTTQESSAETISTSTQTGTAGPDGNSQPDSHVNLEAPEAQAQHEMSGGASSSPKGKERVADIADTLKEVSDGVCSQDKTYEGDTTFGQLPLSLQRPSDPYTGSSTWQLPTVPLEKPNELSMPHTPYPPPPSNSQPPGSLQPEPQASESESETLFIGNVGYNVTGKVIQDVFASKGFLVKVDLPGDLESGTHAGFGFLHFPSTHSAKAALTALQGAHVDGHSINLEFCHGTPHNPRDAARSLPDSKSPPVPPKTRVQSLYAQLENQSAVGKGHDNIMLPGGSKDSTGVSMLDETVVDPEFSARYPSLLAGGSGAGVNTPFPRDPPEFAAKGEMPEFPPVSQVDAHIFSNSHRLSHPTPSTHINMPDARQNQCDNSHPTLVDTADVTSTDGPSVSLPSRYPRGGSRRPMSMREPRHQPGGARFIPRRVAHEPYRSNTVTTSRPATRPPGSSIHTINGNEFRDRYREFSRPDAWLLKDVSSARARLTANRNEQHPRQQDSFHQVPRTTRLPIDRDEGSGSGIQSDARHKRIKACVETLLELGYGSMRGGRQRMTIYAEAADGKVSEAIDMIEEERKAYAQQGSLI